jgi:hypothetical protein
MSIHIVPTTETYQVRDDSVVTVRITIGEAQGGGWIVAWDAQHVIAKGADPDVVRIGTGSELRGRKLKVITTAVDIRPETNRLSRTLALDGGDGGKRQVVDRWDDGADGDAAVFTTEVRFL